MGRGEEGCLFMSCGVTLLPCLYVARRQRVIVALLTWVKQAINYFEAFVQFDSRKERVSRMASAYVPKAASPRPTGCLSLCF